MAKGSLVQVFLFISFFCDTLQISTHSLGDLQKYTRHRRRTGSYKCTLPPQPENGEWKLIGGEAKPGDNISESSVIKFECKFGYKLSVQNSYWFCDENWRSLKIPECEELCPPLYSSDTFELSCSDKNGITIKCSEATHGSHLEYNCTRFYETPFGYKKALHCDDGSWDYPKPVCQPVCGRKITEDGKPLIFGAKPNEKLEYPWVTAVYEKVNESSFEYICGGSILSQTVVLTAAHCVTNEYGDAFPKENYGVGAGKLYRKYRAPEDPYGQYLELSKIIVHDQYKGSSRRFLADIAILVTKGEFVLSEVIQPVCFNNMNSINLHTRSVGEVSGWGRTEDDRPSEVLRTLKIPYKYETTCAAELEPEFADTYNMIDKICAGFYNQSTSVCDGDSGAGLAFKNVDNNNRYYIHGVLSLAPTEGTQCNIQQNSLYTKVAFYYEYVERLLTKHAPKIKDCILPPHPTDGKWSIDNQKKEPGDAVLSSTILKIQCDKGFKLSSSTTNIECRSAHLMPTCQRLCPVPRFPQGTQYQCTNKEGQTIDCLLATDGSRMSFTCPRRYTTSDGTTNSSRSCTKGVWGLPEPECLPPTKNCGKIFNNATTSSGEESPHPWNVLIYDKAEFHIRCSGSLISQRAVLTAASCLTDDNEEVESAENFVIGAGKMYPLYKDSRDTHAKYKKVVNILANRVYRGSKEGYLADIAVVLVKTPFTFNSFIQPVCFSDGDFRIYLNPDEEIKMTIWGLSRSGGSSGQLLITHRVVYKNEEFCQEEAPRHSSGRFLVFDKMCAALYRDYSHPFTGTGLTIKYPDEDRYYIHGILSKHFFLISGNEPIALATNVSLYYGFINERLPS